MSDMNEERDATVTLELTEGYRFRVDFDLPGVPTLLMDEPAPIGEGVGPNAARVLAAAVGNCPVGERPVLPGEGARGRTRDADHWLPPPSSATTPASCGSTGSGCGSNPWSMTPSPVGSAGAWLCSRTTAW